MTESGQEKPKILCVEDHKPLARIIQLTLMKAGYQVTTVHSGDQAVAKAKEINPALVLLDVMMPQMDGFQILKALREEEAFRELPVIVVTARDKEEDISIARERGACDYITKPFQNEYLVNRVNAALAGGGSQGA